MAHSNLRVGRAAAAAALLALVSCSGLESSRGPRRYLRSVRENARPDGDAVARLRIAQDAGSTQPVRIMAMPAPSETPSAAPAQNPASTAPNAQEPSRPTLLFDDVLRSVEDRFPLLLAVEEEIAIAEGRLQSARGGFDVRAKGESDYAVEGFYDTEYQKFSIEQPTTFLGATLVGGYKLGNGNFPEWDGDFETNGDGEVSAGVVVPLLAGRDIDGRRLALWQARVAREQADPEILAKRLDVTRKAAAAYWKWVAAGQKLRVFQRLLTLAEARQTRVQQLVDAGEFAPITVDDNRRLVVERQGLVIIAERGLQEAAINLSLYLRSSDGQPRLPIADEVPGDFPSPPDPDLLVEDDDITEALRLRPELRALELQLEQRALDLAKAENDLLPQLDLGVLASDDSGPTSSVPDDKGPFELDVMVNFELPLQRRVAKGKIRSIEAKMRQMEAKLRFAEDSVRAQVLDAGSELRQTWRTIAFNQEALRLATILEEAERGAFRLGNSNLIDVNIREQQTAGAAAKAIDVLARHFKALADYRAALGVPYVEAQRARPLPGTVEDGAGVPAPGGSNPGGTETDGR